MFCNSLSGLSQRTSGTCWLAETGKSINAGHLRPRWVVSWIASILSAQSCGASEAALRQVIGYLLSVAGNHPDYTFRPMSFEQISYLAQIIASVGVVVSLIFVGLQIRQNTGALQRNEHNSTM